MWPYFVIGGLLTVMAVIGDRVRQVQFTWWFAFLVLIVFVGLRHHVGMDWNNYLYLYEWLGRESIDQSTKRIEPGFVLLTVVSRKLDLGIYGVNFAAALVLCSGVFRICYRMREPWLGLLAAYPYLMVVIGNSATRQSIAAGVLFWLVASWREYSVLRRIFLIVIASMFHYSAAMFLIFVALDLRLNTVLKFSVTALSVVLGIWLIEYGGARDYYLETYVTNQFDLVMSPGAFQHTLLNGVPAAILLSGSAFRRKLEPSDLMLQMAFLALLLIPVSFYSSTAASRITVYLFPVSIYVLSSLASIPGRLADKYLVRTLVACFLITQLFVWLYFANNRAAFLPYQNILFGAGY